jgi:psiF repeat-containing protein
MRVAAVFAFFLVVAAGALAQDKPPGKPARLEERNTVCAAQADDRRLRGATRSAYMKQCIRGGTTPQIAARQEKILACTEEAEDQSLEARERRRFLAECLRG